MNKFLAFSLEFQKFFSITRIFFLTVGENNFCNKIPLLFQVLLPVPDYVYTMLPLDQMKTMTFSITPVLFNVGINEKATLAHKMGLNAPQEKNNIDNFKALAEYYRRYKKLHLNTATSKNGKSNCFIFLFAIKIGVSILDSFFGKLQFSGKAVSLF